MTARHCYDRRLTRPEKRNALDAAMLDALYEAFTEDPAPTDRLIVLRAEGTTYCAGVDMNERLASGVTSIESPVERVFHAMEAHPPEGVMAKCRARTRISI